MQPAEHLVSSRVLGSESTIAGRPGRSTAPPARRPQPGSLPPGWPLWVLLLWVPLTWALGLSSLMWLAVAVPMTLWLWTQPPLYRPAGLGFWLLFLSWMLLSATQLADLAAAVAFGYRMTAYIAGAVMLVYMFNMPRRSVSDGRILTAFAVYWSFVILAGLCALVLPSLSFHSPFERLLPGGVVAIPFVHELVHPVLANVQDFLGYAVARPSAPFTFTNEWGSVVALLMPLYWFWLTQQAPGAKRVLGSVFLVVALVPVIVSLNRGLWISLAAGLLYAGARLALRGQVRPLRNIVVVFACLGVLLVWTPLGGLATDRVETGHSDESRETLYSESIAGIQSSPLLGYGGPVRQAGRSDRPPVGTHGQVWLVGFSHGIPALLCFLAFMLTIVVRTATAPSGSVAFWVHVVFVIALVQLPLYTFVPAQMSLLMIAAGWALRSLQNSSVARP